METCEKHPDKPITSWCKRHETELCIDCLLHEHKECINDVDSMPILEDAVRDVAMIQVNIYQTMSTALDVWNNHGKKTLKALRETKGSLTTGITRTRNMLIERVNDLAKESIDMVNSVFEDQERIVKNDIKDLQLLNDEMVTIHDSLQDFFGDIDSKEITSISRDRVQSAKSKLKEVEISMQQNRLLKRNIEVMFYISKEVDDLQNNLKTFGELCVHDLSVTAKRPTSTPFPIHIGKVGPDGIRITPSDVNTIYQHDSVCVLSPPSNILDRSLYSKIGPSEPLPSSPPPLPTTDRKQVTRTPSTKPQLYRKRVQSDNTSASRNIGRANELLSRSSAPNIKPRSIFYGDVLNGLKACNEEINDKDEGLEAPGDNISQNDKQANSSEDNNDTGISRVTSENMDSDLGNVFQATVPDEIHDKPRSKSAAELHSFESNQTDGGEFCKRTKRHSYSNMPSEHERSQLPSSPISKQRTYSDGQSSYGSSVDSEQLDVNFIVDENQEVRTIRRNNRRSKYGAGRLPNSISISGMCVIDDTRIVLCKPRANVVNLANHKGEIIEEFEITEPFGCCKVGDDSVAVTSRAQKSLSLFRVNGNELRLWKRSVVTECHEKEVYGIRYSPPYFAIASVDKVLILDEADLKVTKVVEPMTEKNKSFYQNVRFVELLLSDRGLEVFTTDLKREVVACTDVVTETVKWSIPLEDPTGVIIANTNLFVASKFRVTILKPENGSNLKVYMDRVPKKPVALDVLNDSVYVSMKTKDQKEINSVRIFPLF